MKKTNKEKEKRKKKKEKRKKKKKITKGIKMAHVL